MSMAPFVPDLDDPRELARYGPLLRQALTIRATERRLLELFAQGRLFGTVHTCIGQEFTGPAVTAHLQAGDTVFSNHRCHGHFLAYCDHVDGLIAEVMGKSTGVCGGLGGSQHLHHRRFYSNGVQGGIMPVATGLALAHQCDRAGAISVVFVGDGTLGEGVLYESLNLASRWDLPLLVVLENNRYAQSTPQSQTLAGDIEARARAFGIETSHSSTWQWGELVTRMGESVTQVRATGRPHFHVVDTYRLMAHSKGDDDRPVEEVTGYDRLDPLTQVLERHRDHAWLRDTLAEIEVRVARAVEQAEAAPFRNLETQIKPASERQWQPATFVRERVVAAIRNELDALLARDPRAILFGEDVESPYGGAFKVTAGLSETYPGRVRNTPISEAAIVGLGSGLALAGYHPVAEIMFGDFLTLATDQWVNHAAKFAGMYNGQVQVPLVVRTPMGGHRGYGPTHSQSLERLFLGHPGTRVLALHHRANPARVYRALFSAPPEPTLVVENKLLYGVYCEPTPPAGFQLLESDDAFPMSRLRPEARADVTLLAIGGISVEAERAQAILFEEHEVLVDLFLPTALYPFDASVLDESLAMTGRLLVAEEGQGFASLSAEILAQVAERPHAARVACGRIHAAPRPIPSARPLEVQCLPDAAAIVERVLEVLRA
ncbi:MAG: thiamine pyrophosphate-dependent enzyme [Candidatus Eisenbacteria bacterium]